MASKPRGTSGNPRSPPIPIQRPASRFEERFVNLRYALVSESRQDSRSCSLSAENVEGGEVSQSEYRLDSTRTPNIELFSSPLLPRPITQISPGVPQTLDDSGGGEFQRFNSAVHFADVGRFLT